MKRVAAIAAGTAAVLGWIAGFFFGKDLVRRRRHLAVDRTGGFDVPKGKIDVNAEDGVVYLRGEADTPEMIAALVARARRVQGVRKVESLLHPLGRGTAGPGAQAPLRERARDARPAARVSRHAP